MQKKVSIAYLFSIVLAVAPILDVYATPIPSVSMGELFVLLLGTAALVEKRTIVLNRFRWFYLYMLVSSAFLMIVNITQIDTDYLINCASYILYAYILLCASNTFVADALMRTLIKCARVISVISLIQFILLRLNVRIAFIIPFLETSIGKSYAQMCAGLGRIAGPFTEPAHLAQYLALPVLLILFRGGKKRDLILFTATMLLTLSGNSLLLLAAIFGAKVLYEYKPKNLKVVLRTVLIVVAVVTVSIYLINTNEVVHSLFLRVYEITGNSKVEALGYVSASGYFRIKYGFDFWLQLPVINQLLGIGVGSFHLYPNKLSIIPKNLFGTFGMDLLNYRSGFTTILIDGGLVAVGIYLWCLLRKKDKKEKCAVFVLIVLQLISGIFNTIDWILYLCLIPILNVNLKDENHKALVEGVGND